MKMNYDLLREILLSIEDSSDDRLSSDDLVSDEHTHKEISYHIQLLVDAGYVDANPIRILGTKETTFAIKRITFTGHEYLNTIRDNKVWRETKTILSGMASVSVDIIKSVASSVTLKILGLS